MNETNSVFRRSAGVFVWVGEEFLVLRRTDGYWDLPAGKVNQGETFLDAARRELLEESDIDASPSALKDLGEYESDCGSFGCWHFGVYEIVFSVRPIVRLNAREHCEYAWVTPQQLVLNEKNGCLVFPKFTELLFQIGYLN